MTYFTIEHDLSSGYTGDIDGSHKWGLPGVLACPACQATWGDNSRAYPSVDLTALPQSASFEEARAEPIEEYERLCDLVRHPLPPGAELGPGTSLGPLVGRAQGRFGGKAPPGLLSLGLCAAVFALWPFGSFSTQETIVGYLIRPRPI